MIKGVLCATRQCKRQWAHSVFTLLAVKCYGTLGLQCVNCYVICKHHVTEVLQFSDINDCESVDCNNGTCIDQVNGYQCNCDSGYVGTHCETGAENNTHLSYCPQQKTFFASTDLPHSLS